MIGVVKVSMYLEVITTKERIGFGGSSYGGGLGNRTVPTKDIALAIGRGYFFVPVREPRDRPSDALGALRVGIKKPTPCGVGSLRLWGRAVSLVAYVHMQKSLGLASGATHAMSPAVMSPIGEAF